MVRDSSKLCGISIYSNSNKISPEDMEDACMWHLGSCLFKDTSQGSIYFLAKFSIMAQLVALILVASVTHLYQHIVTILSFSNIFMFIKLVTEE